MTSQSGGTFKANGQRLKHYISGEPIQQEDEKNDDGHGESPSVPSQAQD